jgi:hypothetical protein
MPQYIFNESGSQSRSENCADPWLRIEPLFFCCPARSPVIVLWAVPAHTNLCVRIWTGFIMLEIVCNSRFCARGNELLGSTKGDAFLRRQRDLSSIWTSRFFRSRGLWTSPSGTRFIWLLCTSKNVKMQIYRTINLTVVLYGCETWSLTLSKEQTEGVWEQGAEENIWTEERWSDGRMEKTA